MSDEWNEAGLDRQATSDLVGFDGGTEGDAGDDLGDDPLGDDRGTLFRGEIPPERPTDRTILTSSSLRYLCVVRHGRDSCVVLAPSYGAVVRVARERRRLLGLSEAERIHPIPMIECADSPRTAGQSQRTDPGRSHPGDGGVVGGLEEDDDVLSW